MAVSLSSMPPRVRNLQRTTVGDPPAEVVSQLQSRRLLLRGCSLTNAPIAATVKTVNNLVHELGFLQLDSINSVERAHHLMLHTRLDGYAPSMLAQLVEKNRSLFEHWTHDASMIRSDWRHWWSHRFLSARERMHKSAWFQGQLGRNGKKHIAEVHDAIRARGPLMARDFPRPPRAGTGWWDWSPQKAALEYLWRTGEIAIHSRRKFDKVYDLAERVYAAPTAHPSRASMIDWACAAALERLGGATPRELAHFMNSVTPQEAKQWCATEVVAQRVVPVRLQRGEEKFVDGVARLDWKQRAATPAADASARLLAPFDPLIRDRARALELFNFDYRFEAFVPAPKRLYGYYTMPVLMGENIVARVDLASARAEGVLRVARVWNEQGCATRKTLQDTAMACERLGAQLGLRVEMPRACSKKTLS